MSCREILGPCLPGSTCRAPEAYAIARLERGHRRLHIQRAKHEANFHHLCLPISASLLRLQRCATMLQIFFWEPRPPFDSPTIALHTIAPRIISIWHSVDNSWSLFIYKSFVDFLSNRTGKKKGKSEDFSSFIFLLKNYSKRRWNRIESTYLRTTVRGHPVLDLWFI